MLTPVSIITPAFHSEDFVARAAQSVLAQTYSDFEMIIVSDDGKDYASILAKQGIADARIKFASTGGIGLGPSAARNAGLDAARFDIISTLDSDDGFEPGHLKLMVPLALKHGAAISGINFLDHKTGEHLENLNLHHPNGLLAPADFPYVTIHTGAGIAFDRRKITARWNENIKLCEDILFAMGLYDFIPAIYYSDTPTYNYFKRQSSLCNAEEAGTRFISSLRKIEALAPSLQNRNAAIALQNYALFLIEMEVKFIEAQKENSGITFQDILKAEFAKL